MPVRRVIVDHISIGVTDLERSVAFYEAALRPLGLTPFGPWREDGEECAFAVDGIDDFAISAKYVSGTSHVAFAADSREQVDAFHAAAVAAGGRDNGPPGIRPEYSEGYYGAFVLDPDGHNVEAVFHEAGPGAPSSD